MHWHGNRFGVPGSFENLHFHGSFSWRYGLVKIDAVIDSPHQHGLCANPWIVECECPVFVRLRIGDRLHAALQLNEDDLNSSSSFSAGAVLHGAMKSSSSQ